MADYVLTMADSDYSVTPVDGNTKVALDGADLAVAPEGDEFDETLDATYWSSVDDPLNLGRSGFDWSEGSGVVQAQPDTGSTEDDQLARQITYGDADIVVKFSDTDSGDKGSNAQIKNTLRLDDDNSVFIGYSSYGTSPADHYLIRVGKWINRAYTQLYSGAQSNRATVYLRIKRLLTAGPSNNYFYFYYSTDGSSWTEAYAGQISAASFDNADLLYPGPHAVCGTTTSAWRPEVDRYEAVLCA